MASPDKNQKEITAFYENMSMDDDENNDFHVKVTLKNDDVNSSPEHANQETSFIKNNDNKLSVEKNGTSGVESKTSINFDEIFSAERLAESLSVTQQTQKSPSQLHPKSPIPGMTGKKFHRGSIHINDNDDDDSFHRELVLKIRKFCRTKKKTDKKVRKVVNLFCDDSLAINSLRNAFRDARIAAVTDAVSTMPTKDFLNDIRANRDLEKFLVSPVVMLDVTHRSLDKIIGGLLEKLQKDLDVDEAITAEAEKAFFTLNQGQSFGASVDNLRETIEGIRYKSEGAEAEQSWITAVCSLPMLKKSHVGIARLRHPLNLGIRNEEVQFVIAVIAPKKEKFTKNAVEIGRTFSTLMMHSSFRHSLVEAVSEEDFRNEFVCQCLKYKRDANKTLETYAEVVTDELRDYSYLQFGRGVYDDLRRRLPHYWSDFTDGVTGKNTIQKLISTVFFLYFACLLPDIAFGTLYEKQTDGVIGVRSCIISQTMAGLLFAFIGGQPMLVMVTTAPLALYVKVIKLISDSFELDFHAMYAMTGIWNCIFLVLEGLFNTSKLMKYSSRSTEEIFELFIALAFAADAIKAVIGNFKKNYHFMPEFNATYSTYTNGILSRSNLSRQILPTNSTMSMIASTASNITESDQTYAYEIFYRPESSILFLFLMLVTLWIGMTLIGFDESHFLSATKREILEDYALPIAVIAASFVGSYLFRDVYQEQFVNNPNVPDYGLPGVYNLPGSAHAACIGLGFCLSCLFFVDQNIAAALINAPSNKLKKGSAYHWDLVIVGLLNIPLSLFALPWVHGAIPHSPLHLKALADVEYSVSNVGTAHEEIVKVRETRLTTIFSHILIGLSLLIIPVLQYVPVAVLEGVFLYLSLTSFHGNQMFDRMLLVFTEGSSYPPNHYVRKVPQRKLHLFTFCQVIQLCVLSLFGFVDFAYMKMVFPVVFLLLLPIRHKILPKIVEEKYLAVLDS